MPTPDGKLRGLYLGDIRPQTTLRNLIRFSLYSDELFVINPFPNPWHIRPAYNPIENPDQYKADTLNLLFFLFSVEPWIESGILHLIPDPGELNLELKLETARLAKVRRGERPADKRDLEEGRELGHEELLRVLCALPEDEIFRLFERSGKVLGEAEKRQLAAYARRTLRNDPVALSQPIGESSKDGQLIVMRAGVNLETALLICSATGAFPYTDMWTRWEELNRSARTDERDSARVESAHEGISSIGVSVSRQRQSCICPPHPTRWPVGEFSRPIAEDRQGSHGDNKSRIPR
jgi:hypothetical protein